MLFACHTLADVEIEDESEITENNCAGSYLISKALFDAPYNFRQKSFKSTYNGTECDTKIEEFYSRFYTTLENELKADEDFAPHVTCLIENLKKSDLAELSMKRAVYESIRKFNKKFSKRKLKKALKAIDYAVEKKMTIAVVLCTSSDVFGELFDEAYDDANSTDSSKEETLEDDYCERKYMVDNNFTNPAYQVNLNPKNVNVSAINCDEIIENSIKEAVDELSKEFKDELKRPSQRASQCIAKVIRSNHYFENVMRIAMLGEIGISDEDKAEERKQFIDNMKQLYEKILKC